jgi:exonuclease III
MKKIKKKGGSTKLSHTTNREKLKSFIDRNNLKDVWRTLIPELERYTWREKTSNLQCRLHFFLISIGVLNVVNNVDIIYGYKSDHSFITVEIEKNSFARGKGFFSSLAHLYY